MEMNSSLLVLISAQAFSLLVGIISYKRHSVSVSGLIALLAISSLFIWLYQIALLFVLFFMFASSSVLTHFKKSSKKEFEAVVAKTGPRDYVQALANLGTSVIALLCYILSDNPIFVAALAGSVSAANADSWASEIGGISKSQPIMITTFRPAQKGLSGGITLAGTLGGIAGSLFISVLTVALLYIISPIKGNYFILFCASFFSGITGFLFDSFLGATLQALYLNQDNERSTENPDGNTRLIKGVRWINNDMVNFLTTIAGASIAGLAYFLFT